MELATVQQAEAGQVLVRTAKPQHLISQAAALPTTPKAAPPKRSVLIVAEHKNYDSLPSAENIASVLLIYFPPGALCF